MNKVISSGGNTSSDNGKECGFPLFCARKEMNVDVVADL